MGTREHLLPKLSYPCMCFCDCTTVGSRTARMANGV